MGILCSIVKCPYCQSDEDKVVDSRSSRSGKAIRRRRECLGCGRRYTTYEYVEMTPFVIVKSDGRREPYDRVKILEGLKMACTKRPISAETVEQMADNIENQLQTMAEGEISAKQIGELAMRQLYQVDEVAYIRFASVYRKFKEVKEFLSEIKALEKSYN
jgi:transcriptional repressor NrdR